MTLAIPLAVAALATLMVRNTTAAAPATSLPTTAVPATR